MKTYNILDEHNRLTKLPVYYFNGNGQYDSHTYSYLELRKVYQEQLGWIMGLETIIPEPKALTS